MAARQNFYQESTAESTTASTTFVVKTTLVFIPDDNTTYHFLWSAMVQHSDAGQSVFVDIFDGTITHAENVREPNQSTDYMSCGGVFQIAYGASPGSQSIEIRFKAETGATARIKEARIIAIKEDTDDKFVESLGTDTENAGTYTTKGTITFTPLTTGDYLVLCSVEGQTNVAASRGVEFRLDIAGSLESVAESMMGQDNTDWIPYCACERVNLTNSSKTIKLEFRRLPAGSLVSARRARIMILRLDAFTAEFFDEARTETNTTLNAFQDKVTSTHTPAAEDHLFIVTALRSHNSNSSSAETRLTEAGAAIIDLNTQQTTGGTQVRRHQFWAITRRNLPASSETWKIQFNSDDAGEVDTTYIREAALAIIQLSVAAAGGALPERGIGRGVMRGVARGV